MREVKNSYLLIGGPADGKRYMVHTDTSVLKILEAIGDVEFWSSPPTMVPEEKVKHHHYHPEELFDSKMSIVVYRHEDLTRDQMMMKLIENYNPKEEGNHETA